MTEEAIVNEDQAEALAPILISEIESFLVAITHRTMMETSEVEDFLLDLRNCARRGGLEPPTSGSKTQRSAN